MSRLSFTILGSSSGLPQPERVNAGYVLDMDGRLVLFDCGGGVPAAFRRAGFDPLSVDRIFISHGHPDHISDLPLFIQMQYLVGKKGDPPIRLYLPGEILGPIRDYFGAVYLLPEKIPFEIEFLPVPEDGAVEFEGIEVTPIRNSHLKGYAPIIDEHRLNNKMQCYSFLIRFEGKTILYSADLGSESDLFPYLENLDLLVVESTHIDVERLLLKAVASSVDRIVLSHISEDYNVDGALTIARKLGMDKFMIARDSLRVDL